MIVTEETLDWLEATDAPDPVRHTETDRVLDPRPDDVGDDGPGDELVDPKRVLTDPVITIVGAVLVTVAMTFQVVGAITVVRWFL